tara:strand:+ start:115181 stop:115603 length:423 start_codon:yes stop_codon:yes gene_type:complete
MRRALILATSLMLAPLHAWAADLVVEVVNLASNDGDVHVALYDNPTTFPKSDGMLSERQVLPNERRVRLVFHNLRPDMYAIAVYHDENGNHNFDQAIFGIPLEDYGFSNDVRVFFSAPSFAEAAFQVPDGGTVITIHLND